MPEIVNIIDAADKVTLIGRQLATEFSLSLKEIKFVKTENLYGMCQVDGTLLIKIQYPDGECVPDMELWRTLAHELSHLRHRNHGIDFWEFNKVLVERISELIGKRVRPEIAMFKRDLGDYKVIK